MTNEVSADRSEELRDLAEDMVLDQVEELVSSTMTLDEYISDMDNVDLVQDVSWDDIKRRDAEIEVLRGHLEDLLNLLRESI